MFGAGRNRDTITGLGWDPESQRSYALQFSDPQNDVQSQTVHHALAFFGLSCLPVLPASRDRVTIGVHKVEHGSEALGAATGSEEDTDEAPRDNSVECLTWPLWEALLDFDTIRSLLSWRELQEVEPSVSQCRAMGIIAVMRSRRFALNKRSYLSPARPVA